MTYEEALEYIHSISWTFCKPGLERIGELCEKLGNPQKSLKFIHVAGTNGKGSFCSMLSSILTEAGYKVGLYTSPYIVEFNERMRISGENITNRRLCEITEKVKPLADGMTDKPTEFELITAIAFQYFKEEGAEIVILEAGMGGRLDSTNIIDEALLSVITGISLDHTTFLGDTVEKIAEEKAGIIKCGCPVLFGGEDSSANRVITARADLCSSPIFYTDYSKLSITDCSLSGTDFNYKSHTGMHINLLGTYQARNASSVLEAVEILRRGNLIISEEAVKSGLAKAVWHARFEIILNNPLTIFDGAHNPEGIEGAVRSIEEYFGAEKVYAITGVLKDKDYRLIADTLARVCSKAFTITPDNPRALTAKEYAAVLSGRGIDALPTDSIGDAVARAIKEAMRDKKALVCLGSLYTYGDIVKEIQKYK